MKKVLWLGGLLALLLLGLPGLFGRLAESALREQMEMTQPYPELLSVSISSYDRKWFSSEVVYEVGLSDEYIDQIQGVVGGGSDESAERAELAQEVASGMSEPLELVSRVQHGPVGVLDGLFFGMFRSITNAGENNPSINEFVQASGMPYLFEARGTTGFGGSTALQLEVPPIQVDGSDAGASPAMGAVRFSGLLIDGDYDLSARSAQLEGGFETLEIEGEEAHMLLSGMQMGADSYAVSDYLWAGPAKFVVQRFEVRSKGAAPSIAVDGISMDMEVTENADAPTVNMNMLYGAQQVRLPDSLITDAQFGMQLDSLSIAAMDAYTKFSQSMAVVDEEAVAQMQSEAQGLIYQFAQASPVIALTPLQFTRDGEQFNGNLSVRLDASKLPAADAFSLMDIAMWSQVAAADGELTLSKGLAETIAIGSIRTQMQTAFADDPNFDMNQLEDMAKMQAPMMLSGLVQQGLLREANEQYSAKLKYQSGELTVNDQPMPIGALLQ